MKKVLYISYDGMTDPLGQSQVLPYLVGLSKHGYKFTILSFEKKQRYAQNRAIIESITKEAGIEWVPLSFTTKPPVISKFYDAIRMRRKAFALQRAKHFDMIHCRSYIAADIGLRLKKRTGVKFFFDMRGFWADEKRDGGAWKDDHPIFKRVYKYYKKREAEYLQHADHIISLTHAGKKELVTWPSYKQTTPVSVIPCCADTTHFTLTDGRQKEQSRSLLGLPQNVMVMSYLGSVGAWYMLDEMLMLFARMLKKYPDAIFLFITHSPASLIEDAAKRYGIPPTSMRITEANRKQVPPFMKASDINVSFIKPVYSKISSSPTKLGEVLSMGIPVIVNSGVGDVQSIVEEHDAGIVISEFNDETFDKVIDALPGLIKKDPQDIRRRSLPVYDLEEGIRLYLAAYHQTFNS